MDGVVECRLLNEFRIPFAEGMCRSVDQVFDDGVALELFGPVDEVLPEKELGEGKGREDDLLGDLEVRDVLDGLACDLPDARDVDGGAAGGKLVFELGDAELEIVLEHLEKRRVEADFVLVQSEAEA